MAISASSKGAVNADINVTPMADVMLVLLIIFMITAPLIASGFDAKMPEGINLIKQPEDPNQDITLGIDRQGNYYINARSAGDTANVRRALTEMYTNRQNKILFLKADHRLTMYKIQEAVSIARASGVRVIAAVTEQRPGTEPTVSTSRPGAN